MKLNRNTEGEKHTCQHNSAKHLLHMILCCGLPIVILALLPLIAGISPVIATVLGFVAPFICPIMMGGMMFMMFRGNKKKQNPDPHD